MAERKVKRWYSPKGDESPESKVSDARIEILGLPQTLLRIRACCFRPVFSLCLRDSA